MINKIVLVCCIVALLAGVSSSPVLAAEAKAAGAMELKSSAFQNSADIPKRYSCDADDVSPPLGWQDAPAGARAFALIMEDPDAPGGTWVHWVIYDVPAGTNELGEALAGDETLKNGAKQGRNDFGKTGYGGPCPPPGPSHRYFFKLYALDAPTRLQPRAARQQLLDAIKGHILAEAELIGRYQR